jgi:RHS repeat-associated protein
MKLFSCFSIKRQFRLLILFTVLLTANFEANADCELDIYINQTSGPSTLCGSQRVTLTAEFYPYMQNNFAWGTLKWYTEETGGTPFQSDDIFTNQYDVSKTADVMVTQNLTVWVSYFDQWTQCESPRVPYDFYITPTPTIYEDFAYACGNVGRVKMHSDLSGVGYYLYKQDPGGGYTYITYSSTGYIEIPDYDPNEVYTVAGSYGGCGTDMYRLWFDTYSTDPPTVSGNLSIYTGAATILNAYSGNASATFKWYDANGNFLYDGYTFSTPALTTSTTYQVQWYSEDIGGTTCVSQTKYVTVQVGPPPQPLTCDQDIYIYQSSGPAALCNPQTVTLTAQLYPPIQNNFAWGYLKWYQQETGGTPFQTDEISTNQINVSRTADVAATKDGGVWVSYLDQWTGCESPRIFYPFIFTPTPTLFEDYTYACGNVGKVQMHSDLSGVTYYLYKQNTGGGYSNINSNTTGYFEIPDYDPYGIYTVVGWYGGCATPMNPLSFEEFDPSAPTVTGITTIDAGNSTTLTASANEYFFKWYDGSGNFLYDGYSYTTPVLSSGVYTYQVRAVTEKDACVSDPTTVSVIVNTVCPPLASITGSTICAVGLTTPLTTTTTGGTWVSSNPAVATVDANGIVTGVAAGTTTVSYSFSGSCSSSSAQLDVTVVTFDTWLQGLGKGIDDPANSSVIALLPGTVVTTAFTPDAQSLAHTISNVLALRLNEETTSYIPGDFTATVDLQVEYGHSASGVCTNSKQVQLSVSYTKNAGLAYNALNYFSFKNAEFTRVTVTNVNAPQTVNGVAFDVTSVLELTNNMAVTRYYKLADNKIPQLTGTPAGGSVPDGLTVTYTVPANAFNNGVQLEWAWLEDGMDGYDNGNGGIDVALLFKSGATRVDLSGSDPVGHYEIPLLYDGTGNLYVRARVINTMPSGSRSEGPWGYMAPYAFGGHNDKLNWQATTSYSEEGKHKSVVVYYDGTLRSRQTVTRDNTTGQTVVAETMYDMEGRPAVQILPAPGIDNIIAYRQNLNKFNGQADNTNPADYFDFTTTQSDNYGTPPLDENQGTARYYSVQNPDHNTGIHQNIPAANGYPYSVTRYTPDGTGRVMRQSAPGDAHKMGSNHETQYFYGTPEQEELDVLFGTEVGDHTHYFKNMVQDANGQMSVSYVDMQGRTIATALAGESTLEALPGSSVVNPELTSNLLSKNTNLLKGNSIESVSSILVPYNTTYTFAYKLYKQSITVPVCDGSTVTYDCKFDLEIAITDEAGERAPVVFDRTNVDEVDLNEPIELGVGSYSVRKTLTINQAWLQSLVDQYGADGVGVCSSLSQLVTTITAADEQTSNCNQTPPGPLSTSGCIASLGDFDTYKHNYAVSINVGDNDLTPEQVNDIRAQYDAAVAFCSSLDPAKTHTLATIRQQMLADMVPFTGQYADPNRTGSMYNEFNIFSPSGGPYPQPYFKNPKNELPVDDKYYNEYGNVDLSISSASLQNMSNEQFAQVFKESWAKALLPYHPEYSKLTWAETNLGSSYDFIDNLQANTTAFDPIPSDPFFNIPDQATNKTTITGYSNVAWTPVAGNNSMWSLAYGDAFGCKTLMDANQKDACYSNMPKQFTVTGSVVNTGLANVTLTDAIQSQAWTVYKSFYTQARSEMVNGYINGSGRGGNNEALIDEGYLLHFPKDLTEAAKSNAANTDPNSPNGWAALIPDAQGNYPSIDADAATAGAVYGSPCNSYINAWRQALLNCPQLAARSDKEEILTIITSKMLEVCRNGTDGANPYGAASVAPAYSGNANTSFEQVILGVFHDKGITVDQFCHPYGIDFPKPYGLNQPVAPPGTSTVETCNCTQWNKILQEMAQGGPVPTTLDGVNQYLSAAYHDTITAELYAGLLKCGQSYQICNDDGGTDPCPECRVAASDPGCVTVTSIPLLSPQPLPSFLVCGYDKSIPTCYNCTAFVNLQESFATLFGKEPVMADTVPDDMVVWNELFAKYVNYKTGLQHNWLYYSDKFNANSCPVGGITGDASQSDLSICREDEPLNDATTGNPPPSPCDAVDRGAKLKAAIQYQYLKQQAMDNFKAAYLDKCAAAIDSFTVRYTPKEYHYTLYYYDRAGNLVKTVPPKGVQPNYSSTFLDEVKAEREKMENGLPYTEKPVDHSLVTRYCYNSLNKVVLQQSPDAGISAFWYDQVGRPAASRNAKQAADGNVYNYTEYDNLGRIVQASQLTSATQLTDAIAKDAGSLSIWYNNAYSSQNQVIQTVYDQGYGIINGYTFNQNNLRNRVSYSRVWNNIGDQSPASATYYTYDVHGNVDALLQDFGNNNGIPNIMNQPISQTNSNTNQFKKIVYDYNLISGNVNKVSYQPGEYDAYYHRYEYDAENRITDVYSGRDEVMLHLFPEREAHYDYYKHGSLASTTLGQLMVQKQDYAYTLQGWLKGVNPAFGGTLKNGTNTAGDKVQDAYGFSLHYFDNDYNAIGYTGQNTSVLGQLGSNAVSLYNGNIAAMAVNIPKLGDSKVYNYHYDQLNRLVAMDAYKGLDVTAGTFSATLMDNAAYKERISYDPNGNILNYIRNGDVNRPAMDVLTYNYTPGTNKLQKVIDTADDASPADYSKYNDIKKLPRQNDDNYEYDLIGNLTKDNSESVEITWNSYGKMTSTNKSGVVTTYIYDAFGNRILIETPSGSTAYVRDAAGNVLSVYTKTATGSLTQSEVHLYGSSRLGMVTTHQVPDVTVKLDCGFDDGVNRTFTRGEKLFELSNHLGNVLATVTDKRIAFPDARNSGIDHYEADVVNANDYYPFGMLMPGRRFVAQNSNAYRYGFNGKENDNDVKGEGNQQDYGMRVYDPRLGKFLSVDPIAKQYPELTPYQFASNRPIDGIDLDGLEFAPTIDEIKAYDQKAMLKLIQSSPPPTKDMLRVLEPGNQDILTKDFYGQTIIGKRSDVEHVTTMQRLTYNESVGENIRGGFFGSVGYLLGGDRGAFIGGAFDQLSFSLTGVLEQYSYLSKPSNTTQRSFFPGIQLRRGTFSNVQAREWYLSMEAEIPNLINKKLPLKEQAKQASSLRNIIRTGARELMADKSEAERLYKEEPNLTWEQVVKKYSDKGFTGDDLWKKIIEGSQKSRQSVNEKLNVNPKK